MSVLLCDVLYRASQTALQCATTALQARNRQTNMHLEELAGQSGSVSLERAIRLPAVAKVSSQMTFVSSRRWRKSIYIRHT